MGFPQTAYGKYIEFKRKSREVDKGPGQEQVSVIFSSLGGVPVAISFFQISPLSRIMRFGRTVGLIRNQAGEKD